MAGIPIQINIDNRIRGNGTLFTEADKDLFLKIYRDWKSLNEIQPLFGARRLNVPESLTEGLTCVLMNLARTNASQFTGLNSSSFDAIDPNTGTTYQIKACSTVKGKKPGPTSFGPRSEFERLLFVHVDCDKDLFSIYEFKDDLNSIMVNSTETFEDQCKQGRRPRFEMLSKIMQNGTKPLIQVSLAL